MTRQLIFPALLHFAKTSEDRSFTYALSLDLGLFGRHCLLDDVKFCGAAKVCWEKWETKTSIKATENSKAKIFFIK
jgi:hypothetical protein